MARQLCAVLVLAAALVACGTASSPTAKPTPTAPVTPSATVTPSAEALTCWPLTGGTTERARVTDMRIATGAGRDALVVQFDDAVPQYALDANPGGVQFTGGGGKGGTFDLAGSYGLALTISNLNWTVAPGNQFPHGTDLRQQAPMLREVRQIGDYEGIVNIAIGLSRGVCPTVSLLGGPPTLVIEFPTG